MTPLTEYRIHPVSAPHNLHALLPSSLAQHFLGIDVVWLQPDTVQPTKLPTPNPLTLHPSEPVPSEFPVTALGGTFDHLHAGHKILLSMAAWITSEKLIVGMTGGSSVSLILTFHHCIICIQMMYYCETKLTNTSWNLLLYELNGRSISSNCSNLRSSTILYLSRMFMDLRDGILISKLWSSVEKRYLVER